MKPLVWNRLALRLALALALGWGALLASAAAARAATFQVTGTFRYEDRIWDSAGYTGATQDLPIRHADVEVVNANTSQVLGGSSTGNNGEFTITANASGTLDLYVRVLTSTARNAQYYFVVSNNTSGSQVHSGVTSVFAGHNSNSDLDVGTWTILDTDGFGPAQAFNIFDCVVDGLDWLAQPQALNRLPNGSESLIVRWSTTTAYSGSYYSGQFINITSPLSGDTDGWADTVILHEFGHYVTDLFHQDDNPGGAHYLGDNFQDPRLSYGEGYATYFCAEARERRAVVAGTDNHVSIYADLAMPPAVGIPGALEFSYDFETGLQGNGTPLGQIGQACETNVTSALWDLHDGTGTPDESPGADDDAVDDDGTDVWDVLLGYMKNLPPEEQITLEDFFQGWTNLFGPAYEAAELDEILNALNLMGFEADAAEPDDTTGSAPAISLGSYSLIGASGGVVLNEMELGGEDAVEVYNSSNAAVDLANWQIVGSWNGGSSTFTFPSTVLQPGDFVYVRERGDASNNTATDLYGGAGFSLAWSNGGPGACALFDDGGTARDFLRWDGSGDPSTTPVPPGLSWTGTLMSATGGTTLGRDASGSDTNDASDWSEAPNSATQPNGLPFEAHTFYDVGDVDHVSLTLQKDQRISLRTFALYGAADTYVELLQSDGTTVLASQNDRGPLLPESELTFVAPATGTYFARITHVGPYTDYGIYSVRAYVHPATGVLAAPLGPWLSAENTRTMGDVVSVNWLNGSVYDSVRVEIEDVNGPLLTTAVAGDVTSWTTPLDRGLYTVQLSGEKGVDSTPAVEGWVYAGVFPTSFDESFDTTMGTYSWGTGGIWGLTGSVAASSPLCATDSPGGEYADNVDASLELRVPVRLGTSPTLSFRHICITEAGYDYGRVEISDDAGQTWDLLAFYDKDDHPGWNDGVASNGDFVQEIIPLTGYENKVVRIRFRLVTDGGVTADGWYVDDVSISSDVTDVPMLPGVTTALLGNEPNPFNPRTTIRFSLAAPGAVDLWVYDLRGRRVRTLLDESRPAGVQQVVWDGRDDAGVPLASGMYFYRLVANDFEQSRKMLLLK